MLFNIQNLLRELDIKMNWKLAKNQFQSKNAIENWMDEIYTEGLCCKEEMFFIQLNK